jgi:phosphoglycolate phosphatase
MIKLHNHLTAETAQLIIFDKDGTLLDFQAMWGSWAVELAARLAQTSKKPIMAGLLQQFGYDATTRVIDPDGRLAHAPMSLLYQTCETTLREAGLTAAAARRIMQSEWRTPDPATAVPLTNLSYLFAALKQAGLKIAIATSDSYAPTAAAMDNLDVAGYLDAIASGDQGFAPKPSPEMIHSLCRQLAVDPAQAMMVGDTPADMQMGRAAGVGLVIGVLSGATPAAVMEPLADITLASVADLVEIGSIFEIEPILINAAA